MDNNFLVQDQNQPLNVSNLQTVDECENDLKINYNTPGHPIAFAGLNNIYKYYNRLLTNEKIKEILSSVESYTLHRGFRSNQRNPTYSHFKRYMFQMDLVDMQQLASFNNGINYLLTVIDTFTRYAFVRPLTDKTGLNVLHEFKSILNEAIEKPLIITMDRGTEFSNQLFKDYCIQNQIRCYNPDTSIHAAFIERFNRSLQSLIYKYMTENETKTYIDVLPKLVETYNNRNHRMIGTTPFLADTDPSTHLGIRNLAAKYHEKIKKRNVVFKLGDKVRIVKLKNKFSRGYNEQQQQEIFKVKEIKTKMRIPMYILETYDGSETISGSFYDNELVKVAGEVFRIEKVLKKRTRLGKEEYFVKWKGFNDTYNSWVNAADISQVFQN